MRSALDWFPLVMDLMNLVSWPIHACVWLGPTRSGLICLMKGACLRQAWLTTLPHVPIFGARRLMAWLYSALASLADLVGSLAEQVNHDYGGRCCAG